MPNYFSNAEYADILFVYGYVNGNAREAVREYQLRFPNRDVPSRVTFENTFRILRETGHVPQPPKGSRDPAPNINLTNDVLRIFDNDPLTSTRRVGNVLSVPHTAVYKILKSDGRHPFHERRVQDLLECDKDTRLTFCRWFHTKCTENVDFPGFVLWTDEASFTRSGMCNSRNSHHWAHENPHMIRRSHFQHEFRVNVWLGVIGSHVIGPYFPGQTLDSKGFLYFLKNELSLLLEDVPLNIRKQLIFQMDGCGAHSARVVTNWMNAHYPRRWIGRFGPVKFPPRSPDLTPMDFTIWAQLKSHVYSRPVNTREELVMRIKDRCAQMNNSRQVANSTLSVARRTQLCIEKKGFYFEQFK
jgi:hypothetical protein